VGRFDRAAVSRFLARPIPEAPFGLVLLDPPYGTPASEVGAVLALLAARAVVAPGATVVIERPRTGEPAPVPDGWQIEKERPYGDTLLVVVIA